MSCLSCGESGAKEGPRGMRVICKQSANHNMEREERL